MKRLTLNPNPFTKNSGGKSIVHALQHSNYILEYIDTLFCLQSPLLCNEIRYYTSLNRGGRRILHATGGAHGNANSMTGAAAAVAAVIPLSVDDNEQEQDGGNVDSDRNSSKNIQMKNWNGGMKYDTILV